MRRRAKSLMLASTVSAAYQAALSSSSAAYLDGLIVERGARSSTGACVEPREPLEDRAMGQSANASGSTRGHRLDVAPVMQEHANKLPLRARRDAERPAPEPACAPFFASSIDLVRPPPDGGRAAAERRLRARPHRRDAGDLAVRAM
jgi:hypothetical protein